jgi:hypothetical protein
MSRSTVNRILVVYFIVTWTAVLVRFDHFPLTWVPMYSVYKSSPTISVRVVDKERMAKGLFVTHRDGSTSYVSKKDLNISKWHFWRLYYKRVFGRAPAKDKYGNRNLSSFNRWLRGLDENESSPSPEWDRRIFRSLNKTLGYEPSDPKFIIRIKASYENRRYFKENLGKSEQIVRQAVLEWKEEWGELWNNDTL